LVRKGEVRGGGAGLEHAPDGTGLVRHPRADRLDTVCAVLIAVLLFSDLTVEKLAVHAIGPEEVRQVSDGDRIVIANPRPAGRGVGADGRADSWRPRLDRRPQSRRS